MLLIALTGGTPAYRTEVARRLEKEGKAQLVAYEVPARARGRHMRLAEEIVEAERMGRGGLVITHIITTEEAEVVRARGGAIWCVMGSVSDTIPLLRHDPRVTHFVGGARHYRDCVEVMEEQLARVGQRRLSR